MKWNLFRVQESVNTHGINNAFKEKIKVIRLRKSLDATEEKIPGLNRNT